MEEKYDKLKKVVEKLQGEMEKRLERFDRSGHYPDMTDLRGKYNIILKKTKTVIDTNDWDEFFEPVDEKRNEHYQLRMGMENILGFIEVETAIVENKKLKKENASLRNKIRRLEERDGL